ncbi:MAG TPA: molybdopterin-dependent oxidoreductase [Candidatus Dormibacteraeota bacterium]|nr:molybdopterin-dependent oxidoreductase [Candidatus Dormibacteraeota bacterium]
MERRDFLKISAVTGASAALTACGSPDHQLIRFIPEEDLIPGIATWKPSVCTLCPAGCGLLVRVMEGDAEVVRNGQLGLMQMGLAKKLEGNPAHPINKGKLCPRGQAGLQVTYHPDRVRNPLARSGPRGSGEFMEISWDEAMKQLVSQLSSAHAGNLQGRIAFVSSPLRGQKRNIAGKFVGSFKNSQLIEFAFFDERVIRTANAASFHHEAPPTVDLAQSSYVLSFGANFLGTWNSPVAQSVGYGEMRKGRPGMRGKLVQFEPRISQTAANADEWIPCTPGTEGMLALSIAHVLIQDKLRAAVVAGLPLIDGWPELADFAPEKVAGQTGVRAATITRIAHEAAAHAPAVALIGDAAAAHTNSLFNAVAVNALNALLGSAGKPGGIQFSPVWNSGVAKTGTAEAASGGAAVRALAQEIESDSNSVAALLLYGANPVFATPNAWGVRKAFEKAPFIASFGSFIDETSILADLILPDHSPLESWIEDTPDAGSTRMVVSVAPPAMLPLHDTRAMPDVLLDAAHQLGGNTPQALPWKTYDEAIQADFAALYKAKGSKDAKTVDDFWSNAQQQGGWWGTEETAAQPRNSGKAIGPVKFAAAEFDGNSTEYPYYFMPFPSQMLYDGSLADLPWMQEAPDPMSSAMWGTWLEMNPETANKLGIKQADLVEVASQHGTLRAPAMITPGIAPDVIAMPIGQGHENYTRFASNRGANPISILAPMSVAQANTLAWAATRVKISRVGEGQLILFGGSLRESTQELRHR